MQNDKLCHIPCAKKAMPLARFLFSNVSSGSSVSLSDLILAYLCVSVERYAGDMQTRQYAIVQPQALKDSARCNALVHAFRIFIWLYTSVYGTHPDPLFLSPHVGAMPARYLIT